MTYLLWKLRYCSYVFRANPSHKFNAVVAYNIYNGKSTELKTQYQQLKGYCLKTNIKKEPKYLSRRDFAVQCETWRKEGERLGVIMDASTHIVDEKPQEMVEGEGGGLVAFSYKSWGAVPPNIYINGKIPHRCWIQVPGRRGDTFLHALIHKQPWL